MLFISILINTLNSLSFLFYCEVHISDKIIRQETVDEGLHTYMHTSSMSSSQAIILFIFIRKDFDKSFQFVFSMGYTEIEFSTLAYDGKFCTCICHKVN